MKILNKKGLMMLNYAIWIMRFIFLAILLVSVSIVISKYVNLRVDIAASESEVALQRIVSSDALMYASPVTSRTYPAIIDMNKIKNAAVLDSEIDFGKARHISAKVSLQNKKSAVFLNKRIFEDLFESIGTIFGTDVQDTKNSYWTFVDDNGKKNVDILTVQVLQAK